MGTATLSWQKWFPQVSPPLPFRCEDRRTLGRWSDRLVWDLEGAWAGGGAGGDKGGCSPDDGSGGSGSGGGCGRRRPICLTQRQHGSSEEYVFY